MADESRTPTAPGLEADIRSLRQDVTRLMVDVGEIKGIVSGFRMAFDQMDKRLADLASQVDKRFGDVDKRFSTIQWTLGLLLTLVVLILGKLFLK